MIATGVRLEVSGIAKTYRRGPERVVALDGVSFSLGTGELVALVGPSGSGKTSLLNILAGWEDADDGRVSWLEGDRGAIAWDSLAILPQRLGLVEEITIRENVALPVRLAGGPKADQTPVEDLLTELGLGELADRLPEEVSLGEQQRAALARALVLSPAVLLADEPSGHQDEGWTDRLVRLLHRTCERGMTGLLATHDRALLAAVDRVLYIRDGRLVQAGS
jgi:putative ABC transport system ATP-binding protein